MYVYVSVNGFNKYVGQEMRGRSSLKKTEREEERTDKKLEGFPRDSRTDVMNFFF